MKELLSAIFAFLLIISRIAVGLYVLWYLIGCIFWPGNYPLEKMTWFVYFFVWDLWMTMSTEKIKVMNEEQNAE
jgi:hypothetical protein